MEFTTVAGDWVYVTLPGTYWPQTSDGVKKAIKALDDAGNIIIQIVPIACQDGSTAGLLVRTSSDVRRPADTPA